MSEERLTLMQRQALKSLAKYARKHGDEPLSPADWETYLNGPDFEVGLGLDFGDAFIGNIGNRELHDFTAVGDVVNTASRLQGQAAGGEVVVSGRVAQLLDDPPGVLEQVVLKGKQEPVAAYRVRWFAEAS